MRILYIAHKILPKFIVESVAESGAELKKFYELQNLFPHDVESNVYYIFCNKRKFSSLRIL